MAAKIEFRPGYGYTHQHASQSHWRFVGEIDLCRYLKT
jgi:hypothetical protein